MTSTAQQQQQHQQQQRTGLSNRVVPVTTLSAKRYAETFGVFLERTSEYSNMMEMLTTALTTTTDDDGVTTCLLPAKFSCLDIGAGTGHVIQQWCSTSTSTTGNAEETAKRQQRPIPTRYVAIEPNEQHVQELTETLVQLQSDVTNPLESYQVIPTVFDTQTVNTTGERFDVILFSHSLYYMIADAANAVVREQEQKRQLKQQQDEDDDEEDRENAARILSKRAAQAAVNCIEHAMEQFLKPAGLCLIFHMGPYGFYQASVLFEPFLQRSPDIPLTGCHGISSHEIVQGLRRRRAGQKNNDSEATWNISVQCARAVVDLTDAFVVADDEDSKQRGEQVLSEILSFIHQVEFSQIPTDSPIRQDMIHFLRYACHETSSLSTSATARQLLFHHPTMAITIRNK